jgi:hypothetical protein
MIVDCLGILLFNKLMRCSNYAQNTTQFCSLHLEGEGQGGGENAASCYLTILQTSNSLMQW